MRTLAILAAIGSLLGGCAPPPTVEDSSAGEVIQLRRDVVRLRHALTDAQQQLARQDQQLATLQALGTRRLENLFRVARIRLGRFTGGYDSDEKPGEDGVKVYVEPIDEAGSVLKAAGSVTIQLFDLAAPDGEYDLGAHRFDVDTIANHWFSGAFTNHYSFVCPWGERRPSCSEVTVRVTFVEYLTGKTFIAQKRAPVEGPPPPATRPAAASE